MLTMTSSTTAVPTSTSRTSMARMNGNLEQAKVAALLALASAVDRLADAHAALVETQG